MSKTTDVYKKEKYTFSQYHYIANKIKNKAIFAINTEEYVYLRTQMQ